MMDRAVCVLREDVKAAGSPGNYDWVANEVTTEVERIPTGAIPIDVVEFAGCATNNDIEPVRPPGDHTRCPRHGIDAWYRLKPRPTTTEPILMLEGKPDDGDNVQSIRRP
jgi:hypothetical protein